MAQRTALTASIEAQGIRKTLAAVRRLPKDAHADLRVRTKKLSQLLARRVRAAGRAEGGQAAAVAKTVKVVEGDAPAITVGGPARVASTRTPASKLVFGSEFGARRRFGWYRAAKYGRSPGRQYKRHLGRGSYWIFKTVEANQPAISKAWQENADSIVDSFKRGGA